MDTTKDNPDGRARNPVNIAAATPVGIAAVPRGHTAPKGTDDDHGHTGPIAAAPRGRAAPKGTDRHTGPRAPSSPRHRERRRSIHDYTAANHDELSVHVGEVIFVVEVLVGDMDGWGKVIVQSDGREGLLPLNYTEAWPELHVRVFPTCTPDAAQSDTSTVPEVSAIAASGDEAATTVPREDSERPLATRVLPAEQRREQRAQAYLELQERYALPPVIWPSQREKGTLNKPAEESDGGAVAEVVDDTKVNDFRASPSGAVAEASLALSLSRAGEGVDDAAPPVAGGEEVYTLTISESTQVRFTPTTLGY